MGYYINPPHLTKREFLDQEGHPISMEALRKYTFDQDTLPVCLVQNEAFDAAAIAYDEKEMRRMIEGTGIREHQWYLVPRDILAPYLPKKE
jgi:hypothetical protein